MKLSNDFLNIDLSYNCLQNLIHYMVRLQTKHIYQVSYQKLKAKYYRRDIQHHQRIKTFVL